MSYMDKQFARFPHISEEIFDQLDNQNLVKCRRISKSWCNYLDDQKILYIRIIKQSIKSSNYIKAPPHSGYRGCLNSYSDACLDRNPYGLENGVDVRILEQIGTRKYAEMLVILRNADMMGKQSMKSSDFKCDNKLLQVPMINCQHNANILFSKVEQKISLPYLL